MHHPIVRVSQIELAACSPQVTLLIEVALEVPVCAGRQGIRSDVELPSIVQERVVDVFLNDASPL